MRSLLDINVLIALFDADHPFHQRAHDWWAANSGTGWASCPLTENGCVRIMSNRGYSRGAQFSPSDVIAKIKYFADHSDHQFWPDDLSLRDESIFAADRIHRSSQITDLYLVALASKHNGRLASLDESITISAIPNARSEHLCII